MLADIPLDCTNHWPSSTGAPAGAAGEVERSIRSSMPSTARRNQDGFGRDVPPAFAELSQCRRGNRKAIGTLLSRGDVVREGNSGARPGRTEVRLVGRSSQEPRGGASYSHGREETQEQPR